MESPAPLAEPGEAWSAPEQKSGRASLSPLQAGTGSRKSARVSALFEFSDAEEIKRKVRESKAIQRKASYSVDNFYKSEGFFQAVAKSPRFENLTLGIICLNAMWIAIDTDWNTSTTLKGADGVFVVADSLFFGYFSLELFIRFCAFQRKRDCLKDGWFVFDTSLVALYAFDPFFLTILAFASGTDPDLPTSVLKLLRLARLSRLVRMLRSMPELMIMIKAMFTAAASVSYTLGLLIIVTYVFGIAMTLLSNDFGDEPPPDVIAANCWMTVVNETTNLPEEVRVEPGEDDCPLHAKAYLTGVAQSMYTLIIHGTFLDDLSVFADAIKAEPKGSTLCMIVLTIFIIFASMTIMNMLIGVLCEVISAVAAEERESIMVDTVHAKFDSIVKQLDTDEGGTLSWVEFQQIMGLPEAIRAFESVKVDPELVIDFAQEWFIDEDGEIKELSLNDFMDMVLDLRGGQDVHMKDIMNTSKRFNRQFSELNGLIKLINEKLIKLGSRTR